MKVSGSHELGAGPEQVWAALTDPAVLARTLPGCLSLERIGADEYRVTVEAGVGSIKGVYSGRVALADQRPHSGYTLQASGQGGPGTVDATAAVTLTATPEGGTRIAYDADAVVGGTVGGVGQRVLAGVAKRTAGQFFAAVEADLAAGGAQAGGADGGGGPGAGDANAGDANARTGTPAAAPAGAPVGQVFQAAPRAAAAPPADPVRLLLAALVGAAIALAGVLVGRRGPS